LITLRFAYALGAKAAAGHSAYPGLRVQRVVSPSSKVCAKHQRPHRPQQ
jgi:hypothetical protein